MESIFLPINVESNRVLNQDELTIRRRIDVIQGENYDVYFKYLSGSSGITPAIDSFSLILRSKAPSAADLLTGGSLQTGSGEYPYKVNVLFNSLNLASLISGREYLDCSLQLAWAEGTGIEILEPVTTRIVATDTVFSGSPYVSSVNGVYGALEITGAGGVTVSRSGSRFTISGAAGGGATGDYASNADLAATGAALEAQIADLYPRSNPSGFITGVDLSPYATAANLNATGASLQGQIATLSAATGGYLTASSLTPYALASNLAATGAGLQSQISSLAAATGGYLTAIPSDVVRTTGAQEINGSKSFVYDFGFSVTRQGDAFPLFNVTDDGFTFIRDYQGYTVFSSEEHLLRDSNNASSVAWSDRKLYNISNAATVDWSSNELADNAGTATLLWGTRELRGNWTATGVPTANGHVVNKSYLDAKTGELGALFYPVGNPFGYITSSALTPYATAANLATTGASAQSQINAIVAATGGLVPVAGRTNVTGKNFYGPTRIYNSDSALPAAAFEFRWLYSSLGARFDWEQQQFDDVSENFSANFLDRALYDSVSVPSLNWSNRTLSNADGSGALNWQAGLVTGNGYLSIDWANRTLNDTAGANAVVWGTRQLMTTSGYSLDWNTRVARSQAGAVTIDWNNRQLSGDWQTNTTPTQSGHLINKAYFDANAGAGGNGYTLAFSHAAFNYVDNGTYYFGNVPDLNPPTSSATSPLVYVPKAGTVKGFYGAAYVSSNIASAETGTLVLQVNGVSVATGNVTLNSASRNNPILVSGLNVAVNAADALNFLFNAPAWTTNPTSARQNLVVYIE